MMVKVEVRPGILVRMTEEEAAKRGLVPYDPTPRHKVAAPQRKKAKKATQPVEEAPAPVDEADPVTEEPASD